MPKVKVNKYEPIAQKKEENIVKTLHLKKKKKKISCCYD